MTERYTRRLGRDKKMLAVDTPEMRAAVNLVIAVDDGETPDTESLAVLAGAFKKVFGGKNPKDIFGGALGLVPTVGRQAESGFTPAEIVSALVELKRREFGEMRGSLTAAKRFAAGAFIDIGSTDAQDKLRVVDRDWKQGRRTAEALTSSELIDLIHPYKVHDNK